MKSAFEWIEEKFGGVDILINNAGVYKYWGGDFEGRKTSEQFLFIFRFLRILDEGDEVNDVLKNIVDVNLMGTVYCSRAALRTMKSRDNGYIVNINSIAGHFIPFPTEEVVSYNIYGPSKFGVTAFTETLRQELVCSDNKDKIRITSISPGEVKTEMVTASGYEGNVDEYFSSVPVLLPEDIADGVIYVLSTPSRVSVAELTIRPTGERA